MGGCIGSAIRAGHFQPHLEPGKADPLPDFNA